MALHSPLRAIILGVGENPAMKALTAVRPSLLFHIADKPLVEHLIEHLARIGVKKFDFLLHHFPEQIEEHMGDGKRWGVEIHTHLLKDAQHPFSLIASIAKDWKNGKVLIGKDDTLPFLNLKDLQTQKDSIFFDYAPNEWSGWACVDRETLLSIPSSVHFEELPDQISKYKKLKVSHFLNTRTYRELASANTGVLSQDNTSLIFPSTAKKVEPGVWISRGVTIEPGVTVTPPVFIGEFSHIKAGALIGPNAVIENHCIIDNDSAVENSLICQNSYVGEFLEVKDCIVDRNSLINVQYDTEMNIKEDFILSSATPPSVSQGVVSLIERSAAIFLFILFLPIYLYLKLTSKITKEAKIRLPASENKQEWTTFDLCQFKQMNYYWLPMLINIIKGELHFVGVPPRGIEETEQLPQEWQLIYLKSKPGIITLCEIEHGIDSSEDEQYASEAFYAVQKGFLFDLKMIVKWLIKKMKRNFHAA